MPWCRYWYQIFGENCSEIGGQEFNPLLFLEFSLFWKKFSSEQEKAQNLMNLSSSLVKFGLILKILFNNFLPVD